MNAQDIMKSANNSLCVFGVCALTDDQANTKAGNDPYEIIMFDSLTVLLVVK